MLVQIPVLLICLQELAIVDHEKIYYAPFRKSFYVEVPEIAAMTTEGICNRSFEHLLCPLLLIFTGMVMSISFACSHFVFFDCLVSFGVFCFSKWATTFVFL